MKPHTNHPDPFLKKLLEICDDAGTRAELRRYWSATTRAYAYPILGRLQVKDPRWADAVTAALYSIHPHHADNAYSVGQAALALGERKEDKHPYDSHFRRLLASNELDEVAKQLHRLIKRISRESIAIDYHTLLWDLRRWAKDSEAVKTRWAMDFWRAPQELAPTSVS